MQGCRTSAYQYPDALNRNAPTKRRTRYVACGNDRMSKRNRSRGRVESPRCKPHGHRSPRPPPRSARPRRRGHAEPRRGAKWSSRGLMAQPNSHGQLGERLTWFEWPSTIPIRGRSFRVVGTRLRSGRSLIFCALSRRCLMSGEPVRLPPTSKPEPDRIVSAEGYEITARGRPEQTKTRAWWLDQRRCQP